MQILLFLTALLLLGCASAPPAGAQAADEPAPQWIDESWRSMRYPGSEWFTGFARGSAGGQPDYRAIEKEALGRLSESVRVQVQSAAQLQTSSRQLQSGGSASEATSTEYTKSIATHTSLVLAKTEAKSYYDRRTGEIYGFAFANKRELANFYRSMMASLFSFADKEFAIIEQQIEQGKKSIALERIPAVEDSLKSIGFWNSSLQAAESDNSYFEKEKIYWQRINAFKMQLQSGAAIYLDMEDNDLKEQLAAQMQASGCKCSMAKTKEAADYIIAIKAEISRCIEAGYGEVYCYANASATVSNAKHDKPAHVKIPEAKGGWTGSDKGKAAEEAFKELANSLAEQIIPAINQ